MISSSRTTIANALQQFARQMSFCDAAGHEDVLAGPQGEAVGRRRPRDAHKGGGRRLRGVAGDAQALAQAARADGLGRPQEEAGHEAPRVGSTTEERHALWRRLEENPEATLQEHREAWERERGVRVSVATMSRAIRRLGWTYYKKRRWEPPPNGTRRPEPSGASG